MSTKVSGRCPTLYVLALALGALATMPCSANVGDTGNAPAPFPLSRDNPISESGTTGLSSSTQPVDILSFGVHFRIPRNYIESTLQNMRDREMDFTLHTLYPDFHGSNVDGTVGRLTTDQKTWVFGMSPNLIRIVTGHMPFSPEHDPNTIVFTAEENEPDLRWKYGLLKSSKRSWGLANVYFERPSKANPGYMVGCATRETDICNVYMRISPELVMQYQFHRDLLPHWREINQKITQLIQSFIVK